METKCNICLDDYDKFIKIPRRLNCAHFFCQYCLSSLLKKQSIVCPNCRLPSNDITEISDLTDVSDFLTNLNMKDEVKEINTIEHLMNEIRSMNDKIQKYYFYIDSIDFGSKDMINTIDQNYNKTILKYKNYFDFIEKIFKDFKENIIYKLKSNYDIEKALLQEQTKIIQQNKLELEKMLEKLECYNKMMNFEKVNNKNLTNMQIDIMRISQNFETIFNMKYKKNIILQNIDLNVEKVFTIFDLVQLEKKRFHTEIYNEELYDLNSLNEKNIHIYFFYPFPNIDVNTKKFNYRIIIYDVYTEALKFLDISSQEEFNLKNSQSVSFQYLNKIYLISGNSNVVFNCFKKTFKKKNNYEKNQNILRHSLVKIEYNIYFLGGFRNNNGTNIASNECSVYDVLQNEWSTIAQMNESRYDLTTCNTNQKRIYVFGGRNEKIRFLDSIEYLDLEKSHKWITISVKMPFPSRNSSSVYISNDKFDKIFILGGEVNEGLSSKVMNYDVNKNEWSFIHNMQFPRYNNFSFYHNKFLYVIAGNAEIKDNGFLFMGEKYSIQNDKWSVIENQEKISNPLLNYFDIYCVPCGIIYD